MCHMSGVRCQMSLLNPYQTVRARNLQFSHNIYFTLWVQCHISGVTYQGSHVSCHMSIVTCQLSHVNCGLSMIEQLRARPFNDWTAAGAAVPWLSGRAHGPMTGLGTDHVTGVGQWEASKKLAWKGDIQTRGHRNYMKELAKGNFFENALIPNIYLSRLVVVCFKS